MRRKPSRRNAPSGAGQGQRQQKQEGRGVVAFSNPVAGLHPCRIETGGGGFEPRRVVYDGALGNNAGLQAVTPTGLHLISQLRHDSKLYLPYAGDYSGKGRRRKYGERLALFRARKYTRRILNSLGRNGEEFLIDDRIFQTAEIGRIHAKAA
ncbi:MAG: transposase [Proteobacteria bacterium]|nr:transposase [Pseudomonadota bacterium]